MTQTANTDTNAAMREGNSAISNGTPLKVKIGDQFRNKKNNTFTVVDFDRLCIQLHDNDRNKTTTLSRKLLKEWIDHILAHGFKNGRTTREEISPKSDIDPFEHGQESILPAIANGVIESGGDATYFDWSQQQDIQNTSTVAGLRGANRERTATQIASDGAVLDCPGNSEDRVLLRLVAALRAKPFAILAGHSGSGKSRLVRKLAYMTCKAGGGFKALFEKEGKELSCPGNFCMVQVKPNWHDSTDLLGYYSELSGGFKGTEFVRFLCRAYAYPEVPFFVCLDEMNLAPVEQYFAEYLSAIESRKIVDGVMVTDRLLQDDAWRTKNGVPDFFGLGCETTEARAWLETFGLTIPKNLFVVGTVNMDETTNQFSRKVLDRAFTIEMTDADFDHFGEKKSEPGYEDFAGEKFAEELLKGKIAAGVMPSEAQKAFLSGLKGVLQGTSFAVAYRFANEYLLYEDSLKAMKGVFGVKTEESENGEAADDMVLMKVLPRISGDSDVVMRIFAGEGRESLEDAVDGSLAKLVGEDSASWKKMEEIEKRGVSNGGGMLTFWP